MAVFIHPDVADLEAFTLGTLDGASLSAVEAHIPNCPACQERAAGASGDSLVELLRRAHAHMAHQTDTLAEATAPGQTPAPIAGDSEAVAPAQAGPATLDLGLGELARHERYRVVRLLGEGGLG
jgi:anti-sigma factor RsiW